MAKKHEELPAESAGSGTKAEAVAAKTRIVRKASDTMRAVGRIEKELESLTAAAQAKVLDWVNRSYDDGSLKSAVPPAPRADQPSLPYPDINAETKAIFAEAAACRLAH